DVWMRQVHGGIVLAAELEAEQDEGAEEGAGSEASKQCIAAPLVLRAAADPAEQGEDDSDQVERRRDPKGEPTEQSEARWEDQHLEEAPAGRHPVPLRHRVPHPPKKPMSMGTPGAL